MSYINEVDNIIADLIDDFHENYLANNELFEQLITVKNFSDYYQQIVQLLKTYIDNIDYSKLSSIINNSENLEQIVQIINRYIVYYFFLMIAFYYPNDKNSIKEFRKNFLTFSDLQKTSKFTIRNFFDVQNTAKIIEYFKFIKNLRKFLLASDVEINALDPKIYPAELSFMNTLGKQWINDNLLTEVTENNETVVDVYPFGLIKTIVFIDIYKKQERNSVLKIVNEENDADNRYTYIDILVVDKSVIDYETFRQYYSDEPEAFVKRLYRFINDNPVVFEREDQDIKNVKLIQFPFVVPIIDDYLRYHRDGEKIENEFDQILPLRKNLLPSLYLQQNKKKDNRRIQVIVNKNELVSEYYSVDPKNTEMRKNILSLFYPPLMYRKVVSINFIEELKSFNKILAESKTISDNSDNYLEMSSLIESAYQNFKDLPYDKNGKRHEGFTFLVETKYVVELLRFTNIEFQTTSPKDLIETRTMRPEIQLNILGFSLPPFSRKSIRGARKSDLVDIRTITINYGEKSVTSQNGLKLYLRMIKYFFIKTFTVDYTHHKLKIYHDIKQLQKLNPGLDSKVIYWLYNVNDDVFKSDYYQNITNASLSENIKYLNGYIHDKIYKYLFEHLQHVLFVNQHIDIIDMMRLVEMYLRHYQFDIPEVDKHRMVIENYYHNKKPSAFTIKLTTPEFVLPMYHPKVIKHIYRIFVDTVNPLHPQKAKTEVKKHGMTKTKASCEHDYKLKLISRMKDDLKLLNSEMSNFIDTYGLQNFTNGQYICKICSRILPIDQYVIDGTYDNTQQRFITAYIPSDQRLEDMRDYRKYITIIRFWYQQIEQFALITETSMLLGSTGEVMNKKKSLIKTMIDIMNAHGTRMMKKEQKQTNNLSVVTFFELDDSILKFEIDPNNPDASRINRWKINNMFLYFVLLFISELNGPQIANMFSNKIVNIYQFEQNVKPNIKDLKIRKNTTDKQLIPLNDFPIMSYLIFVCGYLLIYYKRWYIPKNENRTKVGSSSLAYLKVIYNSVVDLLNGICDEYNNMKNTDPDHHIYSIFLVKIYEQMNHLLKNTSITKYLLTHHQKYIPSEVKYQENTIPILTPEQFLPFPLFKLPTPLRLIKKTYTNESLISPERNVEFDANAFCPTGTAHQWPLGKKSKATSMICQICGYNLMDHTHDEKVVSMEDAIFFRVLKDVAKKRCLDGSFHIFNDNLPVHADNTALPLQDTTPIPTMTMPPSDADMTVLEMEEADKENSSVKCLHCHQRENKVYTNEQLLEMLHNIQLLRQKQFDEFFKEMSKLDQDADEYDKHYETMITELLKDYEKTNKESMYGTLQHILKKWIDTLEEYLGTDTDLNLGPTPVYLRDDVFVINHKFNGALLDKPIILRDSENKMIYKENHSFFKRNVYWYHDKHNDVEVFYDSRTFKLIGHREGQRNYEFVNIPNTYLEVNWSIKKQFYYLGYPDQYVHLEEVMKDDFYNRMNFQIDDHLNKTKGAVHRIFTIMMGIKNYDNYLQTAEKTTETDKSEKFTKDSTKIIPLVSMTQLHVLMEKNYKKNNKLQLPEHFMEAWNNMRFYFTTLPIDWKSTSIEVSEFINVQILSYYDVMSNVIYYYLINQMFEIMKTNPEKIIRMNFCQMFVEIIYYVFQSTYQKKHSLELIRFDYLLNFMLTGSEFVVDLMKRGQGLQTIEATDEDVVGVEMEAQAEENMTEEEKLRKEQDEEAVEGFDMEQEEWQDENAEDYGEENPEE